MGLLSQSLVIARSSGGGAIVAIVAILLGLGVAIFLTAGIWKVFEKAGKPGWACIVPIYNVVILVKISGRPMWWAILCCIPYLSILFFIPVGIDIARKFGKGTGFGVGLALLGGIFFPILGYGSAQYQE